MIKKTKLTKIELERFLIGKKIWLKMIELNMSKAKLSRLSGVDKYQVNTILKGKNCHLNTLLKICHVLGIDVL